MIKGKRERIQERLMVLFDFLEIEFCKQTRGETSEVETGPHGVGAWAPSVLFTYKLTWVSPVLPQDSS